MLRLACDPCDYDLVLCNFNLPDGTGLELRAEQPAATRSIPFVLMIDFADPRVNDILKTDAQCPILIKPFSLAQLMTAIPRGEVRRVAAPTLAGGAER